MKRWIQENRKALSLGAGALLIIVSIALLFWTNMGDGVSDEERIAAANVARMEARMASRSATEARESREMDFMGSYAQKQKMQLRYMLIAMLVGGVCFLGYGLVKKGEEEEQP